MFAEHGNHDHKLPNMDALPANQASLHKALSTDYSTDLLSFIFSIAEVLILFRNPLCSAFMFLNNKATFFAYFVP